jgi:flagellar biogenesis protein FliO
MSPDTDILWTTVKLAGVLVALVAVLIIVKRFSLRAGLGIDGRTAGRIVHTIRLGPRTFIAFLYVPQVILILGVTPNQISTLMRITDPETVDRILHKPESEGGFSRMLKDRMKHLSGESAGNADKRSANE